MLTIEKLRFSYEKREILKDLSFDVNPGEITVMLGPSGAGKSTLLKCMAMIEKPSSGKIILDKTEFDFNRKNATYSKPWPELTVCFQQQFLWPHMTCRDNIMIPAKKHGSLNNGIFSFDDLVRLFNMEEYLDRYPNQVSPGQKQRVALARALLLNPRYILLDEITTFLDVEQVSRILDCLEKMRDKGIGLFLITHLVSFASEVADSVIFFDEGQILEQGSYNILNRPKTERLARFLSSA